MGAYGFGPSSSEAAGFNPYGGGSAAAMNVSDGRADAMGLFDDPRDYTQYDPGDYVRSTVIKQNPMAQNQMTGRVGEFIPDMRDIMQVGRSIQVGQ
jgi:hypothetical protein